MNRERVIHPAEERLLDAALVQLFAPVSRQAVRGPHPWLAAALVLLGVVVTATTMWLARDAADDTAQEPVTLPLPPSVSIEGKAALEALPVDTENLIASILLPGHSAALARLPKLRRLVLCPLDVHIGPINTRKILPVWDAPPADWLVDVARLPALESLQISFQIKTSPALLAPLARCTTLRELELHGEHVQLDDTMIAALAAIPSLRSLRFDLVSMPVDAIAKLARLRLTSLRLSRSPGFDAASWRELCRLKSLQELKLTYLGRSTGMRGGNQTSWMPAPEDLRALAALPDLRRIELHQCACTDEHLASLPDTLTGLGLRNLELTPDGFRSLQRFGALRDLHVGTRRYSPNVFVDEPAGLRRDCAAAVAAAIGTLRLRSLELEGEFTPELGRAVAAQPDLTDLQVSSHRIGDVGELAAAPALRRLLLSELRTPGLMTIDTLAPLRACPRLESLELYVHEGLDVADVQKLFGDRVVVTVRR
jgi:hypothetical protein